jgi:hypothetical protein
MRKYLLMWVALVGTALVVFGSVLMVQGFNGRAEVKASIAAENITLSNPAGPNGTITDEVAAAIIPKNSWGKPVNSPERLKYQQEVIREHTLARTDGKTYAEMPRLIPQLNENGEPVLDENGAPVMVSNAARDIWVTSTTWQMALNLGYLSWKLTEFLIMLGFTFVGLGIAIWTAGFPIVLRKFHKQQSSCNCAH